MYIDIPESYIRLQYIDIDFSFAYSEMMVKFGETRLSNGLFPDSVKFSDEFRTINIRLERAKKRSQDFASINCKDKDYIAWRKKWRNKTMMQPSIRASKNVISKLIEDNYIYPSYEEFKSMLTNEIKNEYVLKYGELEC